MRVEAQPDRLTASGLRVRDLAGAIDLAGRDVAAALDAVAVVVPQSPAAPAAAEAAAEAAGALRVVVGGIDALGQALVVAAGSYTAADRLPGVPAEWS